MDCLSRIKQKYTQEERLLRVSTAQRLKTATGYPQLYVARSRHKWSTEPTSHTHTHNTVTTVLNFYKGDDSSESCCPPLTDDR